MNELTKNQSVESVLHNRGISVNLCHRCVFYDFKFNSCIFPPGFIDRKIHTDGVSILAVISCCSFVPVVKEVYNEK